MDMQSLEASCGMSLILLDPTAEGDAIALCLIKAGHKVERLDKLDSVPDRLRAGGIGAVLLAIDPFWADASSFMAGIRALPGAAGRVWVLAATAHPPGDHAALRVAGFDCVLTTPYDGGAVLGCLERILNPEAAAPSPDDGMATIVDLAILRRLDGAIGRTRLAQVIATYIDLIPRQRSGLHTALAAADAVQVGKIAHTTAGASGSLGLTRIEAQARTVMRLAEEGADLNGPVQDLIAALDQGATALSTLWQGWA